MFIHSFILPPSSACRFGENCKFEHSEGPKIVPPPRDLSAPRGECFQWRDTGACGFAERCRFQHGPDDDRHNADRPVKPSGGPCYSWRDEGVCVYGEQCRFTHGDDDQRIDHSVAAAAASGNGNGNGAAPKPRRRARKKAGTQQCFAFRDGVCEYGEECRFAHGEIPGKARAPGVCYNWRDNGSCEHGELCKFSHFVESMESTEV